MIKHLLFDADGVLFFHADKLFSERIIEEYGTDKASVESFFSNVFPDCLIGKKDIKQELASRLQSWHWPGTVEELMTYWYTYEHNLDEPLIDHIRLLKRQGLHASVATNNDHYRAESLFHRLNLDESVFDTLYTAGDIGVMKPDPAFFEHILHAMPAIKPHEILFWDDSEANLEPARELGLQPELYTTYEDFAARIKHYV